MCSGSVYFLVCVVLVGSVPVDQNQTQDQPAPSSADTALPYNSYLQQVVEYLEKDPHFREKLRQANTGDISEGKLSRELEFVHHSVRSKLDELKRDEMLRLRMLLKAKKELKNNGRLRDSLLRQFQHLDVSNPHSFEIQDLDHLIKTATRDLQDLDTKQHEAFKRYEMKKEHDRRQQLKNMSETEREREETHHQEMRRRHADHPKVNHPGSEDQLKEVWHETDGLDTQDFNPRTFFQIHDSNRDGYFDENELEALFTKELEKVYNPQNEEDDLMELEEERLRMREHVFNEVDLDRDGLISEDEFLQSTTREDYHQNQEWQTLDQAPVYSEEELLQFEEHLDREREDLFNRAQELNRQREELEERQRALDQERRGLQQALEQMQKLRAPQTDQHHEEQNHEATTVPHPS